MNPESFCPQGRAFLLSLACVAVATGLSAQQVIYDSEVQLPRSAPHSTRVTRIDQPYTSISTDGRSKEAIIETIRVNDTPHVIHTSTTTVTETKVTPKKTTKVAETDTSPKESPKHHDAPAKKKTHVTSSTRTVAKAKEHVVSKPVRTQTTVTHVKQETTTPAIIYDHDDAVADKVIAAGPSPLTTSQILTINAAPAPRMTKAERAALLRSASPGLLSHGPSSTIVVEKLPDYAEGRGAEVTLFPPPDDQVVVQESTPTPTLKEEVRATPPEKITKEEYPLAEPSAKRGFVKNPYAPDHELDVTGLISGSLVRDPVSGKPFRVP